jgi:hypothetical protein
LLCFENPIYHGHVTHSGREVEGLGLVGRGIALVVVGVVFGRVCGGLGWLVGMVVVVVGNAKSRNPSGDQLGQGASPGPGPGIDR